MGSQSVNCHPTQVNTPRLTPAIQAGTRFTYPGGMEGWVDLVDLIAPWPGVEPATFRSRGRRRTAAPPRKPTCQLVFPTSPLFDAPTQGESVRISVLNLDRKDSRGIGLHCGESCMILTSTVFDFDCSIRVTDGRTDGRAIALHTRAKK